MAEELIEADFSEDQTGPGPKGKKVAKKAAQINRFLLSDEQLRGTPNVSQQQASEDAKNPYLLSDEQLGPIKKKDGGTSSLNGESGSTSNVETPDAPPGAGLTLTDIGLVPGMGANVLNPVTLLNKEQRKEFIKNDGYVYSPQNQKALAADILKRPIDPTEELISFVENGYNTLSNDIRDRSVEISRARKDPEEKIRQDAVNAVLEFQKQTNSKNIRQTITTALQAGDMASVKKLLNDTFTKQNERLLEKYDATEDEERIGPTILKGLNLWDAVYDEYDKESAPLRQQKDKVDQLFTAIASRKYSYLNPAVAEDYNLSSAGGKDIKNEITPNQFSALSFYKENEPEKYKQFDLELGKAANPESYGLSSYNKDNPDYKYMQYQLDKKGAEINAFASAQTLEETRAQKEVVDKAYGQKIAEINQQILNTTDLAARKALQEQANTLTEQYNANPVNVALSNSQQAFQESQSVIDKKYPEQARREREYKVKDILGGDGKSMMGEVVDRLKWMGRETGSGIANLFGIDEAVLGSSRNYVRDLRVADEKQAELYQPQGVAAQQALYKLNFNNDDYSALQDIKDSDLSREEKVTAMTDYVKANEQRLTYEFNPEAGKQNWSSGAIGNQIADVATQVGYQAALMLLTEGAGKLLSTARPATSAIGAVEATGLEASAAGIGDDIVGGINKTYTDLGSKMRKFGSVFGTTFATTYQSAYVNGLQEGLSPEEAENYAAEIAVVNGLTETISPDIDVVKRAAKGVGKLSEGISSKVLTDVGKYKAIAKGFAKGYAQNVVPETIEEVAAAYGEYGVDAIHNINQDDLHSLNNRIQSAITSTMIGMIPLGVFSGANTARRIPQLQKESLYRAGIYPESMTTEINSLVDNGSISQEEANKRIKIVNTASQVIQKMPSITEGVKMNDQQRENYLYNELQRGALQEKLDNATDANTKRLLTQQVSGLETTNAAIVEQATFAEAKAAMPVEGADAVFESAAKGLSEFDFISVDELSKFNTPEEYYSDLERRGIIKIDCND